MLALAEVLVGQQAAVFASEKGPDWGATGASTGTFSQCDLGARPRRHHGCVRHERAPVLDIPFHRCKRILAFARTGRNGAASAFLDEEWRRGSRAYYWRWRGGRALRASGPSRR